MLWGFRVVIPEKRQSSFGRGMVKMKIHTTSLFWWPNLDDIEREAICDVCNQQRNMLATAPVHAWKGATGPWERIHLDFAETNKLMFLVVMDAYTR